MAHLPDTKMDHKSNKETNKKIVIPKHVTVIPDGNRRWATQKKLPKLEGHRKGALNFENLVNYSKEIGIQCFSSWVFSTENWKRDEEEVEYLFDIAREFTSKYKKKCLKENIRFIHLGRKDRLPNDLVEEILDTEEKTKDHTDFTVAIGMDYGGHDELIRAINEIHHNGLEINKENIENNLDTKLLPMPDLIIRTSGEKRLSGFMSWQSAYAEFYFTDKHFPDFGPEELDIAIEEYSNRDRRFGGNSNNY